MAGITTSEITSGEQSKDDEQRGLFDQRTLRLTQTMNRLGGRLAELRLEMSQTKTSAEELQKRCLALSEDAEEAQKEYLSLSECLKSDKLLLFPEQQQTKSNGR